MIVHDLQRTLATLTTSDAATITGYVVRGKATFDVAFQDVSADPTKGSDALAISLLLAAAEADRASVVSDIVDAAVDHVVANLGLVADNGDVLTTFRSMMLAGMTAADATAAETAIAAARKDARRLATDGWSQSAMGEAYATLVARYAASKRASFKMPGTDHVVTLSSVLGRASTTRVAAAFGRCYGK